MTVEPVADRDRGLPLSDGRFDQLISRIRDTFRVRENHDPTYVDVGGHLARVGAAQHVIVFGRRGSGKSCLLIHHHRRSRRRGPILSIYVGADEIKTLPYPDLLIRMMLTVFEQADRSQRWWLKWLPRRRRPLQEPITQLRQLLDQAEELDVTEDRRNAERATVDAHVGSGPVSAGATTSADERQRRTTKFVERKLDELERHLQDYKAALAASTVRSGYCHATVIVDDFYLIRPTVQPDVIDYLHRLMRGTDFYLKIGTVRHRTTLTRYEDRTTGVELYQDVEELDLDQTFEDVRRTQDYLKRMLDSLANSVKLKDLSAWVFNPDGLLQLTLASGGVPRDFLNIFVEALDIARSRAEFRWLTPTIIYSGAARISYRTKLSNLRDDVGADATDLEKVFQDLLRFCLREKKKTAFLVSQAEVSDYAHEHELIKQLMDFKLIHVIEADTSAASGRPGRYEAYTLDFSLFMEPRLRGIEHVEFWMVDANRRKEGTRESPVYPLSRAQTILLAPAVLQTEEVVQDIETSIGVDAPEQLTMLNDR